MVQISRTIRYIVLFIFKDVRLRAVAFDSCRYLSRLSCSEIVFIKLSHLSATITD